MRPLVMGEQALAAVGMFGRGSGAKVIQYPPRWTLRTSTISKMEQINS